MSYPLRENLEVVSEGTQTQVRCIRCRHVLCSAADEWKKNSKRALFPPTKAGPLMNVLSGQFLLEQLFCPSCGALLNTDLVETKP